MIDTNLYFNQDGVFQPVHQHLLIKAHTTSPVTDPTEGKFFLTDLVREIGMNPVTEPQCVYVGTLGNEGLTGSINLATSHVAFHIWDVTGVVMMDVYSCTCFDITDTISFISSRLHLDQVLFEVLNRDDNNMYNQLVRS